MDLSKIFAKTAMKLKKLIIYVVSFAVIANMLCVFTQAQGGYGNVYFNHKNNQMQIALTFDDGPHPRYTPQILDVLKKYDVKATFFVIGENALYYPDALCRAAKEGHEIANHTYSHMSLSSKNMYRLKDEITKCEDQIYDLTGIKTKLFRPPEGLITHSVSEIATELNYNVILWDIDTRDWAHTPPKVIAKNVADSVQSGCVILMHDFIGKNSPTPEALEIFIPILLERGYRFVTVSELIKTAE